MGEDWCAGEEDEEEIGEGEEGGEMDVGESTNAFCAGAISEEINARKGWSAQRVYAYDGGLAGKERCTTCAADGGGRVRALICF